MEEEPHTIDVGVAVEVIDPAGVERRSTANDTMDFISLGKQQLRQVRAILSCYAGDKGLLHEQQTLP